MWFDSVADVLESDGTLSVVPAAELGDGSARAEVPGAVPSQDRTAGTTGP
ncbi:hypothetical protein [Kineococcus terrestris]